MTSDRSTLEGKDRAELTVIAQAMGNKVGSRMRKAQIIDLIVGANETDATDDSTVRLAFDDAPDTVPNSSRGDASADGDESDDASEKTPGPAEVRLSARQAKVDRMSVTIAAI